MRYMPPTRSEKFNIVNLVWKWFNVLNWVSTFCSFPWCLITHLTLLGAKNTLSTVIHPRTFLCWWCHVSCLCADVLGLIIFKAFWHVILCLTQFKGTFILFYLIVFLFPFPIIQVKIIWQMFLTGRDTQQLNFFMNAWIYAYSINYSCLLSNFFSVFSYALLHYDTQITKQCLTLMSKRYLN